MSITLLALFGLGGIVGMAAWYRGAGRMGQQTRERRLRDAAIGLAWWCGLLVAMSVIPGDRFTAAILGAFIWWMLSVVGFGLAAAVIIRRRRRAQLATATPPKATPRLTPVHAGRRLAETLLVGTASLTFIGWVLVGHGMSLWLIVLPGVMVLSSVAGSVARYFQQKRRDPSSS